MIQSPETETQVAKIRVGTEKQSTAFVLIMAENAAGSDAELFAIAELPLFNPAAKADCERITNSIASAFRRGFRNQSSDLAFENTLSEINQELEKLNSTGQSNWSGKLNAVIAAKINSTLYISTTGKITALMLRDKEFTSLSGNSGSQESSKAFENFASGRIKNDDFFIFSTVNLFNFYSLDKIKKLHSNQKLADIAKDLSQELEESCGPEIALGALLINVIPRQPNPQALPPSINTSFTEVEVEKEKLPLVQKIAQSKLYKKINEELILRSKKSLTNKLYDLPNKSKNFVEAAKLKYNSRQKKFFLITALVALIALVVNISLTRYYGQKKAVQTEIQNQTSELKTLLNEAETNLELGNEPAVGEILIKFLEKSKNNESYTDDLKTQYRTLSLKLDKNKEATIETITSINSTGVLINLPGELIVQNENNLLTINLQTKQVSENVYKCPEKIISASPIGGKQILVFNGQTLSTCVLDSGEIKGIFALSVPAEHEFGGIAYYPTANKAYAINKAKEEITSYEISDFAVSKNTTWLANISFTNTNSITVDGAIYTYGKDGIFKWQSGKPVSFNPTLGLFTPLSGQGKIFTQKDMLYLYLLDTSNKRIIISDKAGNLVNTIDIEKTVEPKDFSVDEKAKTIYILEKDKLSKIIWQ